MNINQSGDLLQKISPISNQNWAIACAMEELFNPYRSHYSEEDFGLLGIEEEEMDEDSLFVEV